MVADFGSPTSHLVGDLTYLDDRELAARAGVRLVRLRDVDKALYLAVDFPVAGLAQGEDTLAKLPEIMSHL